MCTLDDADRTGLDVTEFDRVAGLLDAAGAAFLSAREGFAALAVDVVCGDRTDGELGGGGSLPQANR